MHGMVIRRVAPLRVWVDYVGGGGLGDVGAVAAGELPRRNRERPPRPYDPLWVPIEVVECAEFSGLVGGHWGLPEWRGPSVSIRVCCVPDGRERQRALRAKGTRRGSVL